MFARRWCVVLVFLISGVPCAASAQPMPQSCASAIPDNVDAGVFAPDMIALLRRSDTFRTQCARIAESPRVHVRIEITSSLSTGRAQTVFQRSVSGTIAADVQMLFGENYRELLAHEFEHILEQLDGVDLRREVAAGRAWLLPSGAFETRRAFETGVQVLREAQPPHAHAAAALPATR